jgi:hypothetical protein
VRYHLHGPRSPAQKQLRSVPEREVPAAGAKAAIPEVEAAEVAPGATGAPTEKKTTLVKSFPVRLAEFLKVLVEGQLVQPPEGKNQKVALCVAKEKVVSAVVQLHPGAVEACDCAQVAVGFTPRPEIEWWHEIPALFVETEKEDLAKRPEAIWEKIVPGRAELVRKGAEEAAVEADATPLVAENELAVPAEGKDVKATKPGAKAWKVAKPKTVKASAPAAKKAKAAAPAKKAAAERKPPTVRVRQKLTKPEQALERDEKEGAPVKEEEEEELVDPKAEIESSCKPKGVELILLVDVLPVDGRRRSCRHLFEEEVPAEIDATAVVTEGAAKPGLVPAPVEGEEKSIEEKASLLAERETREGRVFALGQDLEEAEKTSHSATEKIHTLEEQVKSLTTESEELRKSQIPKEDFLSVKKNVKELSEDKVALLKEVEALTDEKDEL